MVSLFEKAFFAGNFVAFNNFSHLVIDSGEGLLQVVPEHLEMFVRNEDFVRRFFGLSSYYYSQIQRLEFVGYLEVLVSLNINLVFVGVEVEQLVVGEVCQPEFLLDGVLEIGEFVHPSNLEDLFPHLNFHCGNLVILHI